MRAIFLDIESTGLDPIRHRVIDIAFKIVDVTTGFYIMSYHSLVKPTEEAWERRDLISMDINGFNWDQVSQGKDALTVGKEIITLFTDLQIERGKAVFICQNPGFDRSFFNQLVEVYTQEGLNWPYHWLDLASMFWGVLVEKSKKNGDRFPEQIVISKNEIARHYNLPPEMQPHRAMKGVEHLIQCYEAVLGVKFKG
jgi:DNA polymerase-3 subunit epsilon/oligoribonuclease